MDKGALPQGAAFWIGNAMVETGKGPQAIAEDVAADKLELTELPSTARRTSTPPGSYRGGEPGQDPRPPQAPRGLHCRPRRPRSRAPGST